MAVEKHIIVQTCAKIASELTVASGEKNPEKLMETFTKMLDSVLDDVLMRASSFNDEPQKRREIPIITQDEMSAKLEATKHEATQGRSVKKLKSQGATVTIKGSAEAPPAWLVRQAAKAGVTEVWDNRSNLKDNPKRPHFVSTDESKKAFWPPAEETSQEGSLEMPISKFTIGQF